MNSASKMARTTTLPALAPAGIVLTDLSFTLLAVDRGALTILGDLNGEIGANDRIPGIPGAIFDCLRGWSSKSPFVLPSPVVGQRYSYDICAYMIEPQMSGIPQALVGLHFYRRVSADDVIKQIASDCNLTDREMGVLKAISRGLTSKEIATQMAISPNTVKSYVRLLMVKTGVTTRSGIVGKVLDRLVVRGA